jgi:hypothetical protein
VTPLERRCRLLLRAYPRWYRRDRADEMLDTLVEASSGRRWPSLRDALALMFGGLRARGVAWYLAMLWAGAGAVFCGTLFLTSTQPFTASGVDMPASLSELASATGTVTGLASLAMTIPVWVAGSFRLRRRRLGAGSWTGTCALGVTLMVAMAACGRLWGVDAPQKMVCSGPPASRDCGMVYTAGPAHVSWAALGLCAAWLALGLGMNRLLATPARGRQAADSSTTAIP